VTLVDTAYDQIMERGELAQRIVETEVVSVVSALNPLLSDFQVREAAAAVLARLHGLGPLEPILADPLVSEIMVNAGRVWVERHGQIEDTGIEMNNAVLLGVIERIVAPLGLRVDRSAPLVDARLADGSRVNVVVPPLAIDGPCLTIRRFVARRVPVSAFCPPATAARLERSVQDRQNIVVSGGTGAGKTTLLNALGSAIGCDERVVTIEDAAELQLPGRHVVRLESRPANGEGIGEVSVRRLLRNALRMRPDRIIVGEVRGGEALEMVQAMNTGHAGSLSSCHATTPADALRRLETMMLQADVALPLSAVRDHLHSAIDLIVQVERTDAGERRITDVVRVAPNGELVGT